MITAIIPYTNIYNDKNRENAFNSLKDELSKQSIPCQILVITQVQNPAEACIAENLINLYDFQDRMLNKSWWVNVGIRRAKYNHTIVIDADTKLNDNDYLKKILEFKERTSYNFFSGYEKLIKESGIDEPVEREVFFDTIRAMGCAWYARKDFFFNVLGGMNENFFGYGAEDNELYERASFILGAVNKASITLRHQYHDNAKNIVLSEQKKWSFNDDRIKLMLKCRHYKREITDKLKEANVGRIEGPTTINLSDLPFVENFVKKLTNRSHCNGCELMTASRYLPQVCSYYHKTLKSHLKNPAKEEIEYYRLPECIEECKESVAHLYSKYCDTIQVVTQDGNEDIVDIPHKKENLKILWLYKYLKNYNFDKWLHLEFAKTLANTPGIDLIAYGPSIEEGYPELGKIPYCSSRSLNQIKKMFPFDIIIANTKSRMFNDYCPYNHPFSERQEAGECWLPRDFKTINVPKIMIEEDFHYELNDDWYIKMGFNLLLQRHLCSARRKYLLKTLWYPFSVDTSIFYPQNKPRYHKLAFVGSCSVAYPLRNKAIVLLNNKYPDFFTHVFTPKRINNDGDIYLTQLQDYAIYLSCSSMFNITPAKMFEIMASGGVLFTNQNIEYGLQELFDKDTYLTYEDNFEDFDAKIKYMRCNASQIDQIAKNAVNCIQNKHTHQIRINQLKDIIKKEFGISK